MVDTNHDATSAWIVAGAFMAGLTLFAVLPGGRAPTLAPVADISIRGAVVPSPDLIGSLRESQMSLEGFAPLDVGGQPSDAIADGDESRLRPEDARGPAYAS